MARAYTRNPSASLSVGRSVESRVGTASALEGPELEGSRVGPCEGPCDSCFEGSSEFIGEGDCRPYSASFEYRSDCSDEGRDGDPRPMNGELAVSVENAND